MKELNNKLIYCSIFGYGDPFKERSGFDLTI